MKDKKRKLRYLLFFCFFLFFLIPPLDPDFGWEIRCASELIQKGNFCTPDHFSTLLPNYSWINSRWVYQLLLYFTHALAGFWGVTLLGSTIVLLTFYFLWKTWKTSLYLAGISFVCISLFSFHVLNLGLRAQTMSLLFFSLTIYILLRANKYIPILPIIFLCWANIHGGFPFGLVLVFFFITQKVLEFVLTPSEYKINSHKIIKILIPCILCFFAVLLNPFGIAVYSDALFHQTNAHLSTQIAEWVHPSFISILWMLSFIGTYSVLIILFEKKLKILDIFLMFTFFVLSFTAVRHIPYFYITSISLFLVSDLGKKCTKKVTTYEDTFLGQFVFLGTVCIVIILVLVFRLPFVQTMNTNWQFYCDNSPVKYPCKALEFIKKEKITGRFFNTYEWGGFLLWQLPQSTFFIDGRMPAWRHSSGIGPYQIYLETVRTEGNWKGLLSTTQTEYILITPGTFLDIALQKDNTVYKQRYRDTVSVIYSK